MSTNPKKIDDLLQKPNGDDHKILLSVTIPYTDDSLRPIVFEALREYINEVEWMRETFGSRVYDFPDNKYPEEHRVRIENIRSQDFVCKNGARVSYAALHDTPFSVNEAEEYEDDYNYEEGIE